MRGFWSLFGRRKSPLKVDDAGVPSSLSAREDGDSDDVVGIDTDDDDDDDVDDELDDGAALLGTDKFKWNVIPPEAHHSARLVLASNGTRSRNAGHTTDASSATNRFIQICRCSGGGSNPPPPPSNNTTVSDDRHTDNAVAIVGIGQIVEFPVQPLTPPDNNPTKPQRRHNSPPPSVMKTSDIDGLIDQYHNGNASSSILPSLTLVRSCQLSTNCIAISWGLDDGIIVVYRKVAMASRTTKDGLDFAWHGMAIITPSEHVVEAADRSRTIPTDDETNERPSSRWWNANTETRTELGVFESGLLRVSDMVSVRTTYGSTKDGENGETDGNVLLTIGRLGGFMELLLLPATLVSGPVLAPRDTSRPPSSHYATRLPDLSSTQSSPDDPVSGTLVGVSTVGHHTDLTALAIHRTDLEVNAVWDDSRFPDRPPVEFLVAATGSTSLEVNCSVLEACEGECVSLWGVSLIEDGCGGVGIHVRFLEKLEVKDVGPDVTVFSSSGTSERWLLPSSNPITSVGEGVVSPHRKKKKTNATNKRTKVHTISIVAPVTSLQFVPYHTSTPNRTTKSSLLISIIDYNGGVTIADCSAAARTAVHPQNETPSLTAASTPDPPVRNPVPPIDVVFRRGQPAAVTKKIRALKSVVDGGWWNSPHGLRFVSKTVDGYLHVQKVVRTDGFGNEEVVLDGEVGGEEAGGCVGGS